MLARYVRDSTVVFHKVRTMQYISYSLYTRILHILSVLGNKKIRSPIVTCLRTKKRKFVEFRYIYDKIAPCEVER